MPIWGERPRGTKHDDRRENLKPLENELDRLHAKAQKLEELDRKDTIEYDMVMCAIERLAKEMDNQQ